MPPAAFKTAASGRKRRP